MVKKTFLSLFTLLIIVGLFLSYDQVKKLLPFYSQLTKERVGLHIDLQPQDQKNATYVGSDKCQKCHEEMHDAWKGSRHAKMIQDVKKDPKAIVADFSTLPKDADFNKSDIIFTIGGKFKQRFMLRSLSAENDYVIGNYQYNVQTKKWQKYKPYKDWYKDAFPHDNKLVNTSKTCDGCHFVGFMSTQKRVEPAIACESCHGPGSAHVKDSEMEIYKASSVDPIRSNEVCLQCHMRNYDKRLEDKTKTLKDLMGDVRDYPLGYEPGLPLIQYKTAIDLEDKKFFGNGVGKKNRMQGNEYVHSGMYKHGVTCINCHNPHSLDNSSTKKLGDASCMQCHSFGSLIGPHQNSIEAHTKHKANSSGSSCIECHMPKTGKHTGKSPLTVRTHVFGFITPAESRKYGVANACNSCHKEKSLEWSEKAMQKWGMESWGK
jgi:nitrate/TMAO reductase-like tetraheme cytochrome c subunit